MAMLLQAATEESAGRGRPGILVTLHRSAKPGRCGRRWRGSDDASRGCRRAPPVSMRGEADRDRGTVITGYRVAGKDFPGEHFLLPVNSQK